MPYYTMFTAGGPSEKTISTVIKQFTHCLYHQCTLHCTYTLTSVHCTVCCSSTWWVQHAAALINSEQFPVHSMACARSSPSLLLLHTMGLKTLHWALLLHIWWYAQFTEKFADYSARTFAHSHHIFDHVLAFVILIRKYWEHVHPCQVYAVWRTLSWLQMQCQQNRYMSALVTELRTKHVC